MCGVSDENTTKPPARSGAASCSGGFEKHSKPSGMVYVTNFLGHCAIPIDEYGWFLHWAVMRPSRRGSSLSLQNYFS
jgi:hypothetical protein